MASNSHQKRVTGHRAEIVRLVTRHPRPIGYLLSGGLYADRVRLAMARTKKGLALRCATYTRGPGLECLIIDVAYRSLSMRRYELRVAGLPCACISTLERPWLPFTPLHARHCSQVNRCPCSALAGQANSPFAGCSPWGAVRNVRQPFDRASLASSSDSTLAITNRRNRQKRP